MAESFILLHYLCIKLREGGEVIPQNLILAQQKAWPRLLAAEAALCAMA